MIHHIGEYGNKYLVKYFQRLSGQFRDIPTSYKIPLKKFAVLRFFTESMGRVPTHAFACFEKTISRDKSVTRSPRQCLPA